MDSQIPLSLRGTPKLKILDIVVTRNGNIKVVYEDTNKLTGSFRDLTFIRNGGDAYALEGWKKD